MNTDTSSLPNCDMVEKYGNELLDMQVGQTDMKVRHIFKKFVEVCILDLTIIKILVKKCVTCIKHWLSLFLRQQTTTWKSMELISLTFRTSEYLICLRFPCQRQCTWIRKCKQLHTQKIIIPKTLTLSILMTFKCPPNFKVICKGSH